jgi:hypothetical protein
MIERLKTLKEASYAAGSVHLTRRRRRQINPNALHGEWAPPLCGRGGGARLRETGAKSSRVVHDRAERTPVRI